MTYHIAGTVKVGETGVVRTVRAYDVSNGSLLGEEESESDGSFNIQSLESASEVSVLALDDSAGTDYNDLVYRTTAVVDPDPPGWPDIDEATSDSVSYTATQESAPYGFCFSDDGTKMYVIGITSKTVFQYALSTSWDVSTASYSSKSVSVSSQCPGPRGLRLGNDGTKLYVTDASNDKYYQYTLSTAYDISTATYDSKSVSANDTNPFDIHFKPDGTKMYMVGYTGDSVYQYTLSTPWDISTMSYDNISLSISAQDGTAWGLFFSPDGTAMFLLGRSNSKIFQYSLSTPWSIATMSYSDKSFGIIASPCSFFFRPNGANFYVLNGTVISQYSLS